MNPQISRSITDEHIAELRRQAAQSGTGANHGRDRQRVPWLRRRIAVAMIDTGSRMLATSPPVTTD